MEKTEKSGFFSSIIKGVGVCVISTLIFVLVFAFVAKQLVLSNGLIKTINQFIKVLGVFLGCFICLKDAGFIKGIFIGVIATAIIYLIFALIFGNISFGFSFILDLICFGLIGAFSGALSVNLRKN